LLESENDRTLLEDSLKIVDAAKEHDVTLRLLGAVAISLHSREFVHLYQSLKRLGDANRGFTDMDLIGYARQRAKVRELMEDRLGYVVDQNVLLFRGKERLLYHHSQGVYNVDIFFDKLNFSHEISIGSDPKTGRLLLDYPTLSPTDLLLEKLQIHSISQKDLKDIIVLLRAHQLDFRDDPDLINMKYVAMILSDDWGFWKDATTNLQDVLSYSQKYRDEETLSEPDFSDVSSKADRILEAIAKQPKTLKWKLRERSGEGKQWWNTVEEISR